MQGWEVLYEVINRAGIRQGPPTFGGTVGGTHVEGSFHFRGQALDRGLADCDADAISRLFAPVARSRPDLIPEMFGSDGVGYDEGKPYQAAGHTGDHTHVAIGAGVTVDTLWAAVSGSPGAAGPAGAPSATSAGSAPSTGSLAARGQWLGDPGNWLRILEVSAGAGLVLLGIVSLSKGGIVPAARAVSDRITSTVATAGKVAAVA